MIYPIKIVRILLFLGSTKIFSSSIPFQRLIFLIRSEVFVLVCDVVLWIYLSSYNSVALWMDFCTNLLFYIASRATYSLTQPPVYVYSCNTTKFVQRGGTSNHGRWSKRLHIGYHVPRTTLYLRWSSDLVLAFRWLHVTLTTLVQSIVQ